MTEEKKIKRFFKKKDKEVRALVQSMEAPSVMERNEESIGDFFKRLDEIKGAQYDRNTRLKPVKLNL